VLDNTSPPRKPKPQPQPAVYDDVAHFDGLEKELSERRAAKGKETPVTPGYEVERGGRHRRNSATTDSQEDSGTDSRESISSTSSTRSRASLKPRHLFHSQESEKASATKAPSRGRSADKDNDLMQQIRELRQQNDRQAAELRRLKADRAEPPKPRWFNTNERYGPLGALVWYSAVPDKLSLFSIDGNGEKKKCNFAVKYGTPSTLYGLDAGFLNGPDKDRYKAAGERAREAQSTPSARDSDTPVGMGGPRRAVQPSIIDSLKKAKATPEARSARARSAKRRRRTPVKEARAALSPSSPSSDDEMLRGI